MSALNERQFANRGQAAAYGYLEGLVEREQSDSELNPDRPDRNYQVPLPAVMERAAPYVFQRAYPENYRREVREDIPLVGQQTVSSQNWVNPTGVKIFADQILAGRSLAPVEATADTIKGTDYFHIRDGHHRAVAAALLGQRSVPGRVFRS